MLKQKQVPMCIFTKPAIPGLGKIEGNHVFLFGLWAYSKPESDNDSDVFDFSATKHQSP